MKTKLVLTIATVGAILVGVLAGVAQAGSELPSLHVGSIQQRYRHNSGDGHNIVAVVKIRDANQAGVEKATVTALWKLPGQDRAAQQVETDQYGLAQFPLRSTAHGTYRLCVTHVSKLGWVYDPAQNQVTCVSLVVR